MKWLEPPDTDLARFPQTGLDLFKAGRGVLLRQGPAKVDEAAGMPLGHNLIYIQFKGQKAVTAIPFEPLIYLEIEPNSQVLWATTRYSKIVRFGPDKRMPNELQGPNGRHFVGGDKAIGLAYR